MKKTIAAILSIGLCFAMLLCSLVSINAADTGPYKLISGGCITNVQMKSQTKLGEGAVDYFTATVTSHIQGLEERAAIPYDTYAAIGSKNSKLFVYSVGKDNDLDYAEVTVKDIVEQFEKDYPEYDALVAINGDFFDIESKITASRGEPEGHMIQDGEVLKGSSTGALGRGVVGVKADGTMIYNTFGKIYKDNNYGVAIGLSNQYALEVFGEHRTNVIYEYKAYDIKTQVPSQPQLLTADDAAKDTTGKTVCVIKCDKYRRAHVGINGAELGTQGYFVQGEIADIREGKADDKPAKGYAFVVIPNMENYDLLKKGTYVRVQKNLAGKWEGVTNAIGFKQQILAEGTILLKNTYGNYNGGPDDLSGGNPYNASESETRKWTEDVYDYPHTWKERTAIGFKADGTPVIMVIDKSSSSSGWGASYYEIGEQLKSLGCTNGFLLDGGGSSTFVKRSNDGSFETVLSSENGNIGRTVANAVILAVRDESVPLPVEDPVIAPPEKATKPVNETEAETNTEGITGDDVTTDGTEPDTKEGCGSAVALPVLAIGGVAGLATLKSASGRRKKRR